jgi:hypothetical protein
MMAEEIANNNSKQEVVQRDLSAEAPRILGEKIVPIVEDHRQSFTDRVNYLASTKDWRFGTISERDLKRHLGYLENLEQILKEYAENPRAFSVPHSSRSELGPNKTRYRLTFKRNSDPERLPTESEKALTELNFEMRLEKGLESEKEALAAVSFGRSPDEALAAFEREAPRDMVLMMRTVRVYYSLAIDDIKLDFLPGVIISHSPQMEKPLLEGVVYIADKRFKTDAEEISLDDSDLSALKDHLLGVNEREARKKRHQGSSHK